MAKRGHGVSSSMTVSQRTQRKVELGAIQTPLPLGWEEVNKTKEDLLAFLNVDLAGNLQATIGKVHGSDASKWPSNITLWNEHRRPEQTKVKDWRHPGNLVPETRQAHPTATRPAPTPLFKVPHVELFFRPLEEHLPFPVKYAKQTDPSKILQFQMGLDVCRLALKDTVGIERRTWEGDQRFEEATQLVKAIFEHDGPGPLVTLEQFKAFGFHESDLIGPVADWMRESGKLTIWHKRAQDRLSLLSTLTERHLVPFMASEDAVRDDGKGSGDGNKAFGDARAYPVESWQLPQKRDSFADCVSDDKTMLLATCIARGVMVLDGSVYKERPGVRELAEWYIEVHEDKVKQNARVQVLGNIKMGHRDVDITVTFCNQDVTLSPAGAAIHALTLSGVDSLISRLLSGSPKRARSEKVTVAPQVQLQRDLRGNPNSGHRPGVGQKRRQHFREGFNECAVLSGDFWGGMVGKLLEHAIPEVGNKKNATAAASAVRHVLTKSWPDSDPQVEKPRFWNSLGVKGMVDAYMEAAKQAHVSACSVPPGMREPLPPLPPADSDHEAGGGGGSSSQT